MNEIGIDKTAMIVEGIYLGNDQDSLGGGFDVN